jgi:hypothetical protein
MSSMGTVGTFLTRGTCSQTLFCVLDRAFEHPLREEERASDPLAGGIVQHGYQCGMIWGSTLAAGAEAYRRFGTGPQAEAKAILAAGRIVESFRAQNHETNCLEITGIDESSSALQMTTHFLFKGGTIDCFRMAARYAPVAFREVDTALSEEHAEAPAAPVSCSALLARKMGASDMQGVMAAGFAGGIGLSGGACGALGAAIWITGLKALAEGRKVEFKSKAALDTIDRFVTCTDYEFECSAIVGRKFESVADHAGHLCQGGCSKIIDALAATGSPSAARAVEAQAK